MPFQAQTEGSGGGSTSAIPTLPRSVEPSGTGGSGSSGTSGFGAIIPNAGVYGAESAAALNAYNNAVANAKASRNQLYNQYGLTNSGAVDPNNPYGLYEQMLNAQASQFSADQADAASRNLGAGGLARQQLGVDRNAANAQDFGFQQLVNQVPLDYNQAISSALNTRQGSDAQAYNDALNTALSNLMAGLSNGQFTAPGVGKPASNPSTIKNPVHSVGGRHIRPGTQRMRPGRQHGHPGKVYHPPRIPRHRRGGGREESTR